MELPDEILLYAFSYLDSTRDKLTLTRVSRRWRRVALDGSLWRSVRLALKDAILLTHLGTNGTIGVDIRGDSDGTSENDSIQQCFAAAQSVLGYDGRSLSSHLVDATISNVHGEQLRFVMGFMSNAQLSSLMLDMCFTSNQGAHTPTLQAPDGMQRHDALEACLGLSRAKGLRKFAYRVSPKVGLFFPPDASEYSIATYVLSLGLPLLESVRVDMSIDGGIQWFSEGDAVTPCPNLRVLHLPSSLEGERVAKPFIDARRFPVLEELECIESIDSLLGDGSRAPPHLHSLRCGHIRQNFTRSPCFPGLTTLRINGVWLRRQLTVDRYPAVQRVTVDVGFEPKCLDQVARNLLQFFAASTSLRAAVLAGTCRSHEPDSLDAVRALSNEAGLSMEYRASKRFRRGPQRKLYDFELCIAKVT